eukprot:scaffold65049_cov95-Attheya_sp.AAC.1
MLAKRVGGTGGRVLERGGRAPGRRIPDGGRVVELSRRGSRAGLPLLAVEVDIICVTERNIVVSVVGVGIVIGLTRHVYTDSVYVGVDIERFIAGGEVSVGTTASGVSSG